MRLQAVKIGFVSSLLLGAGVLSGQTPDRFSLDLLEQGHRALARGRPEEAVRVLRLACFGLLEHPDWLARCWVELGKGRAELKDRPGLLEVVERLEELESRFGVYSQGRVDPWAREALESKLVALLGDRSLARSPLFGFLVLEEARRELEAIPLERRERELGRKLEEDPGNGVWRILKAERELDAARFGSAEALLEGLPRDFGSGAVSCLRGAALGGQAKCEEALAELSTCPVRGYGPLTWKVQVACLLSLGRREEAGQVWLGIPEALRARPELEELGGQLLAPEGAPAGVSSSQSSRLSNLRERLRSARTTEDLLAVERELQEMSVPRDEERMVALLRAEIAYRGSRWRECTAWFRTAGVETLSEVVSRFYAAVCLYESGEREQARQLASSGLDGLPRSPFVEGYLKKLGLP